MTEAATREGEILYDFIMALNGLPLAALSPCKECGKWFLQITDREKLYCSSQCRARRASRESYKKIKASDPGKYEELKDRAKARAGKSYRKKIGLD